MPARRCASSGPTGDAAGYLRRPGETAFFPFVLVVLRYEHGGLAEMAAFEQPSMFTAFGLPDSAT